MTLRVVLLLILIVLVARAFWRLVDGIVAGLSGRRPDGVPARGVRMVRDPVCGTFLIRDRALSITDGRTQVFFCSASCQDKYRARTE